MNVRLDLSIAVSMSNSNKLLLKGWSCRIRNVHELGEMKRAQELRVDDTDTHFTIAIDAKTDEFYE